MNRNIVLGVSDKRLSLPCESFSSMIDYIELHLSSLSRDNIHRLLTPDWAGRTPIASGLVKPEDGCLLSLTSRKRVIAKIRERIDIAATMGVKHVVLAAGRARSIPDGMSMIEAQSMFRALLDSLILSLEEADVQLLIEPLNETETNFIHTLQEAYDIIHDVPPHRISLVYDLYHGRLSGERWRNQNTQATKRVKVIHIASRHRGLPHPFEDSWLSRELSDILSSGYSGYVSIEVDPKELNDLSGLEVSLRDMRRFLEECVVKDEGSA